MTTSTALNSSNTTRLVGIVALALCALVASSWVYRPFKETLASWGLPSEMVLALVVLLLITGVMLIRRSR